MDLCPHTRKHNEEASMLTRVQKLFYGGRRHSDIPSGQQAAKKTRADEKRRRTLGSDNSKHSEEFEIEEPGSLHNAAAEGDLETLEKALAAGASLDGISQGCTPLMVAAMRGQEKACIFLLMAGANVNATRPPKNFTPLVYAGLFGHIATAQILIDAGADKAVLVSWLCKAASTGKIDAVTNLLAAGAPPNWCVGGKSPLHFAASRGDLAISTCLVRAGASVNETTPSGMTPLHFAAQAGAVKLVQGLIGTGAGVNRCNNKGTTPLILAAVWGHVGCVESLLAAGADASITTASGMTAYTAAQYKGHTAVLHALQPGVEFSQNSPVCTVFDESEQSLYTSAEDHTSWSKSAPYMTCNDDTDTDLSGSFESLTRCPSEPRRAE